MPRCLGFSQSTKPNPDANPNPNPKNLTLSSRPLVLSSHFLFLPPFLPSLHVLLSSCFVVVPFCLRGFLSSFVSFCMVCLLVFALLCRCVFCLGVFVALFARFALALSLCVLLLTFPSHLKVAARPSDCDCIRLKPTIHFAGL